ncbi:hypothetical protein HC341_07700 [Aquisalimonas sp. 2447]|uniref:hypothetical protein n=1 Tax=Aquisalimonas sp. 2447 TaxID=2740807 RepID=UPI0014323B02|nr:hypothetical protein [Aquisalimonas sp. 2447]QIT55106.1 hypothetical protein HC341_07700 [Aquisalimonas sp. 2447]
MKMKTLVAAAGMIAAQSALAVDGATEQRLVEKGFLPEPVQGTEIVRGVPAEPEHRAEALLVEWGFKPQPMERKLATQQRTVSDAMPEDAVKRTLVEKGFLPAPARTVSTLADGPAPEVDSGS